MAPIQTANVNVENSRIANLLTVSTLANACMELSIKPFSAKKSRIRFVGDFLAQDIPIVFQPGRPCLEIRVEKPERIAEGWDRKRVAGG